MPKTGKTKFFLITGFIALFFYSILFAKLITKLPSPNQLSENKRPISTQILDRNGKLLYQIYDGKNRSLIQLGELPQHLVDATIAIEDQRFYFHPGFDPIGITRAFWNNLTSEEPPQGASTITQQLIKNTMLSSDQTLSRKLREVALAFWLERIYSKKEILQMYFNEAPYGGPAWGIEAASEMYFDKKAHDLNPAESAYLAGLPASPSQYSPYGAYPERGIIRQKEVLRRMVEENFISRESADSAMQTELSFKPHQNGIKAPHFVMYVKQLLAEKYGERTVSEGGLKVVTTLDLSLQEMAEKVVAEEVDKLAYLKVGNGAAMITDSRNGQILGLVGSKDYFDAKGGNFNVALATRQPGSSIKPVTYAVGFEKGYGPSTVIQDMPITFPSPAGEPGGKSYSPVNYDGKFHGPVTIRTALGSSYNVPAVKILNAVGVPDMISKAREMGITTFKNPTDFGLSLTLGGGGVKMIDMMSLYGTLAAGGVRHTPSAILTVTDSFDNVLEDNHRAEGSRVLTEGVAYLLSDILADNRARTPAFGPNSELVIPGHSVAVKTGTSDDKRDNWAYGFTPEYVVGAWVGNNDNSPMNPQLSSGITGATPIWHNIMANLLEGKEDQKFIKPKDVVEVAINGRKDLGLINLTPKSVISSDPLITFTPTPSNP